MLWFLLDCDDAVAVEGRHAEAPRIGYLFEQNASAGALLRKLCDVGRDVLLEDIVAEHDHDGATLGEMLAKAQRIGDSALAFLIRVVNIAQSKLRAVAEETKKLTRRVSTGDDHDLHDSGRTERLQRIIDHRLVVNRQQMFVGHLRQRAQSRAEPARQDHPLESLAHVRPVHARPSMGATRLRWRDTTQWWRQCLPQSASAVASRGSAAANCRARTGDRARAGRRRVRRDAPSNARTRRSVRG